jgi:hypothetical protein
VLSRIGPPIRPPIADRGSGAGLGCSVSGDGRLGRPELVPAERTAEVDAAVSSSPPHQRAAQPPGRHPASMTELNGTVLAQPERLSDFTFKAVHG